MSYDKAFIEEMKQRLLKEKDSLEKDLSRFARPLEKEGEYETIQEDLGTDMDDSATETEINNNNKSLEQSLESNLKDVLDALDKIDTQRYGLCEQTGREIPEDRLRALPAARICADS